MTAREIAVVVVNYNAGDYLGHCLSSLYAAAGDVTLDVVVVDNASRDGSTDRALAAHPQARRIDNADNRGFAVAANQGIRSTSAPYVLLINPDAEVVGGTLAALAKVADERPRAGAIGVMVRNTDGSIQPSARKVPGLVEGLAHAFLGRIRPDNRWSRSYTMADWDRSSERVVEWVSGSAVLLRREALERVGVFDEGYFMYVEDVDLCTRLRDGGWQVLFHPELQVTHEVGVSSRGQPRRMAHEHSRSIERYFRKHIARGPLALLTPLVHWALWLRAELASRGTR